MSGLAFALRTLLYGWLHALRELIPILRRLLRRRHRPGSERDRRAARTPCVPIDDPAFVRPDPLIYDQYYLSSLGFAVTWDNPDIQLFLGGLPVSSSLLTPGTTYEIVARIWNGALSAPVLDLPVHFSYLDFGIGTVSKDIGTTKVPVLGVKGGPDHPAFAKFPWTTPTTPGHYCIQVRLDPVEDANKLNNLGQENTNVGQAHSPVVFDFTLRNHTRRRRAYAFETDAYTPGPPVPCDERGGGEEARQARLARHRRGQQPLPAGWRVAISPEAPALAPDEAIPIQVVVTPPAGFGGTQVLNVNAFHDEGLAGGVTLTVVSGP
jgi:hypothetical protein